MCPSGRNKFEHAFSRKLEPAHGRRRSKVMLLLANEVEPGPCDTHVEDFIRASLDVVICASRSSPAWRTGCEQNEGDTLGVGRGSRMAS